MSKINFDDVSDLEIKAVKNKLITKAMFQSETIFTKLECVALVKHYMQLEHILIKIKDEFKENK